MKRITIAILGILLTACGAEAPELNKKVSVVRAADGNLYSTSCLKEGARDLDDCLVETEASDAKGNARGFFSADRQQRSDRRRAKAFLIWDLLGFHPQEVYQGFQRSFPSFDAFQRFFDLPNYAQPQRPRCNSQWLMLDWYQDFNQYGCGFTWIPYPSYPQPQPQPYPYFPPIPYPLPYPQPQFGELLRVQIVSLNSDKVTNYRLSAVPDTNEVAPYKFVKQVCQGGFCQADVLVSRINQEEFQGLKAKVDLAKFGYLYRETQEIQCLALPTTRTKFSANNGQVTLLVDEGICGTQVKNSVPAAGQLADWLKSKMPAVP